MKIFTLRFGLVLLLTGCAPAIRNQAAVQGATTILVVRHAEKATEPPKDPPLSASGAARAELLVEVVNAMAVTAIFSTNTARTRSTAAPLAARLGLTTQLVEGNATQLAAGLLANHRGQTALVVGHSNTVPDIVAALGAPRPPDICDGEFDNLYVVTVPASGPATVERRKYGAATSFEAGCQATMR